MQEAEADMAKDKGVPVVVLDCRQVGGCTTESQLEAMPEWLDIITLIETPKVVRERTRPRTREELQLNFHAQLAAKDYVVAAKDDELQQLRAQLARLEGVPPRSADV